MMISWSPIWGLVVRHLRTVKRDINLACSIFYWPLVDIIIWGFLGAWIQQAAQFPHYEMVALLGILLSQIVSRGSNIMIFSFTEELLTNNVVNLFSLPISMVEWMLGITIFTAFLIFLTSGFCMILIFLMYDLSWWHTISTYFLFWPPLFLSCLWMGFTCLQIIVLLGKRGMELGFVLSWFFMPFSGAYYPLEVLPPWGQIISKALPMSYVFQGMREYIMHQHDPMPYLVKGYVMGMVYAAIALVLFAYCFNRSRQKGLARLAD